MLVERAVTALFSLYTPDAKLDTHMHTSVCAHTQTERERERARE